MAVVRKQQSVSKVISKKQFGKKSVSSQRPIDLMEELGDTNFGTLNSSKDGLLVSYDSDTDKFILVSADTLLSSSVSDSDLPDNFIQQLEGELNLGNIQIDNLDGGTFA